MSKHLSYVMLAWLRKLDYSIDNNLLSESLLTHPDFPSGSAIKDFLEQQNVKCLVAQLPEAALSQIKIPFLSYVKIGMEE